MSIEWRDAMSVGDATVDADHKHLIELINDFDAAVKTGANQKRVARILLGLVDYTDSHFHSEEQLQLNIRYSYHEAHKKQHTDLLRHLGQIMQEYSAAEEDEKKKIVVHVAAFLKEWLVDHIIHSDLRMKPYFERMRMEKAEMEKLKKHR